MKISELIAKLEAIRSENGPDLEVYRDITLEPEEERPVKGVSVVILMTMTTTGPTVVMIE